MRQLDERLKAQIRPNDTTGLGYTNFISSTNQGEQRNAKPKNNKPICYNCGKLSHTKRCMHNKNW